MASGFLGEIGAGDTAFSIDSSEVFAFSDFNSVVRVGGVVTDSILG